MVGSLVGSLWSPLLLRCSSRYRFLQSLCSAFIIIIIIIIIGIGITIGSIIIDPSLVVLISCRPFVYYLPSTPFFILPPSLYHSLTLLAMRDIFDCPYTHLTYYKPLIDVAPCSPLPHPRFVLCACLCCLLLIYVFVCSVIFRTTFAMRLTKVDAHSVGSPAFPLPSLPSRSPNLVHPLPANVITQTGLRKGALISD